MERAYECGKVIRIVGVETSVDSVLHLVKTGKLLKEAHHHAAATCHGAVGGTGLSGEVNTGLFGGFAS